MDAIISLTDVQRLYKQWQDGQLLDTAERNALRRNTPAQTHDPSFADLLKTASETTPAS